MDRRAFIGPPAEGINMSVAQEYPTKPSVMKTFYVSLTRDLLGCYLKYEAASEDALRRYLQKEYLAGHIPDDIWSGTWKLPWCSIYPEIPEIDRGIAIVIKAQCSPILGAC